MCYSISIIGNKLHSDKWKPLYEILDSAKENKVLEYEDYELSKYDEKQIVNITLYSDGIIYLGCHAKVKDKPYIKLAYTCTEEEMLSEVQGLAKLLKEKNTKVKKDAICDNSADNNITEPVLEHQSLKGAILEINGKEINLNSNDLNELKDLLILVKEFGYKIKEVICD